MKDSINYYSNLSFGKMDSVAYPYLKRKIPLKFEIKEGGMNIPYHVDLPYTSKEIWELGIKYCKRHIDTMIKLIEHKDEQVKYIAKGF